MSADSVAALFDDMFVDSKHIKVNPDARVPYTRIRPPVKSGIQRLMHLFDHNQLDGSKKLLPGITMGSDCAIVVPLLDSEHIYVRTYLKDKNMTSAEIDDTIIQHSQWYGIVDGCQSNEAIRVLAKKKIEWASFQWIVLCIKRGEPIERYKQLARACNAKHDRQLFVEMTLYDELYNLRLEFEMMILEQRKPTDTEVAMAYFGTSNVTRTMTLKSSTAIRLPRVVIDRLGKIMYEECPQVCIKSGDIDTFGAATEVDAMKSIDCRIFRSFVNLTSLRQSTPFMNAKSENEIEAQLHTLHRAKNECQLNRFRPVQHSAI